MAFVPDRGTQLAVLDADLSLPLFRFGYTHGAIDAQQGAGPTYLTDKPKAGEDLWPTK
jgi:hypothetical protein